jgi:PleD family two-component response regulator
MSKKPNFRNVNVLLADSDACLAQAVIHNLRAMGFGNITHVKTSADAVRTIRSQAISFLITEWDMKGTNGVELVRYLRRSPDSPNRAGSRGVAGLQCGTLVHEAGYLLRFDKPVKCLILPCAREFASNTTCRLR